MLLLWIQTQVSEDPDSVGEESDGEGVAGDHKHRVRRHSSSSMNAWYKDLGGRSIEPSPTYGIASKVDSFAFCFIWIRCFVLHYWLVLKWIMVMVNLHIENVVKRIVGLNNADYFKPYFGEIPCVIVCWYTAGSIYTRDWRELTRCNKEGNCACLSRTESGSRWQSPSLPSESLVSPQFAFSWALVCASSGAAAPQVGVHSQSPTFSPFHPS